MKINSPILGNLEVVRSEAGVGLLGAIPLANESSGELQIQLLPTDDIADAVAECERRHAEFQRQESKLRSEAVEIVFNQNRERWSADVDEGPRNLSLPLEEYAKDWNLWGLTYVPDQNRVDGYFAPQGEFAFWEHYDLCVCWDWNFVNLNSYLDG